MRAPEGLAVVEQEPPVRQIQRRHRQRELFGEGSASGKIEGGVPLQMGRHCARPVRESRAVVQIAARRDPPRQAEIETRCEACAADRDRAESNRYPEARNPSGRR